MLYSSDAFIYAIAKIFSSWITNDYFCLKFSFFKFKSLFLSQILNDFFCELFVSEVVLRFEQIRKKAFFSTKTEQEKQNNTMLQSLNLILFGFDFFLILCQLNCCYIKRRKKQHINKRYNIIFSYIYAFFVNQCVKES